MRPIVAPAGKESLSTWRKAGAGSGPFFIYEISDNTKTRKNMTKPKVQKTKSRLPAFPTIGALAGALQVSATELRRAKRQGADGFESGGRIQTGPLLAWLLSRRPTAPDARETHAQRVGELRLAKLEYEAQTLRGDAIPLVQAAAAVETALDSLASSTWLREREAALLRIFRPCDALVEANVHSWLDEDSKFWRLGLRSANQKIHHALTESKEAVDGKTILGKLDAFLQQVGQGLSPAARAELLGILDAQAAAIPGEDADPPSAKPTCKPARVRKSSQPRNPRQQ
jgi:hypothetical protein